MQCQLAEDRLSQCRPQACLIVGDAEGLAIIEEVPLGWRGVIQPPVEALLLCGGKSHLSGAMRIVGIYRNLATPAGPTLLLHPIPPKNTGS